MLQDTHFLSQKIIKWLPILNINEILHSSYTFLATIHTGVTLNLTDVHLSYNKNVNAVQLKVLTSAQCLKVSACRTSFMN